MKKAVITILGLSKFEAIYNSEVDFLNIQNKHYKNMFELVLDNFADEYKIVPIYTKEAYEKQKEFFEKNTDKIELCESCFIQEENSKQVLKHIDDIINKFDRVIIDVTNGLRHIPILMTIDLIIQNIKSPKKIEAIIFGKMEKDNRIDDVEWSEFLVTDIRKYLDLANLSFIISQFKDNYTISKNIQILDDKYRYLIGALKNFSKNIMALSIGNISENYDSLIDEIEKLEKDFILKKDLIDLKKHLQQHFKGIKEKPLYETYLNLAKDLNKKEYILQAVAVLAEAKGLYLWFVLQQKAEKEYKNRINEIKNKVLNNEYTYYTLLWELKGIYRYNCENKKEKQIKNYSKDYKLFDADDFCKIKKLLPYNNKFAEFLKNDLRNVLAHANPQEQISNVKDEINKEFNLFNSFIQNDVFKLKGK